MNDVPEPIATAPVPARAADRAQAVAARLVGSAWFWCLFIGTMFAFPIVRSMTRELPHVPAPIGVAPPFALVDQDGKTVQRDALLGRVWVVDFLSMNDTDRSDALTRTMARLKFRLRNVAQATHLASVTLDPERDDLGARARYAERFHVEGNAWSLLGGDPKIVGEALAGFGLTTDATPSIAEYGKRERILLVDKQARIRGWYATDANSLDALVTDVGMLANGAD